MRWVDPEQPEVALTALAKKLIRSAPPSEQV
jgi:hypothetical protein